MAGIDIPLIVPPAVPETTPTPTALQTAQTNLALWEAAEAAITQGQSYRVGSAELVRANLPDVVKRVAFYRNEVARLTAGRSSGPRRMRGVPMG